MAISLSDVPNEILILIVDHIHEAEALCALARVSRRYTAFAEANLYKNLVIRTAEHARHVRKAFAKNVSRAESVQSLHLVPEWEGQWQGVGFHCEQFLSRCPNLQELLIESPTCNYERWRLNANTQWQGDEGAILSGLSHLNAWRLSKVTLHLDGQQQRYWDPNFEQDRAYSWGRLMALQSITDLTVSCALIHDELETAPAKSSNLRRLSLIECNITIKGLSRLLAAPKALEKLHLGENAHHAGQGYLVIRDQKYNALYGYDPSLFIRALGQQAHSLQEFEYIAGDPSFPSKVVQDTFADFKALRRVDLSEHVRAECRDLVLATAPALETLCQHRPTIKVFEKIMHLEQDREVGSGQLPEDVVEKELAGKEPSALFQEAPSNALTSLKHLHIIMPHGPMPISGSRRTWIQMLSKYYNKHGVSLHVSYEHRTSIYPPILYDEANRGPKNVLLFSTSKGFTEAANVAPDPFGFENDWWMQDPDHDLLAEFDFDTFLHGTDGDFGFDAFGDVDVNMLDFHAHYGSH